MTNTCTATKRNGEPCTLPTHGQQPYCWAHSPETAAKRKQTAAKGGRGKAARRVTVLWDEVREVIRKIEAEELTPPQGNTMIRGYGMLVELAKLDIEQSELEIAQRRLQLDEEERLELLPKIRELEEVLQSRGDSWAG